MKLYDLDARRKQKQKEEQSKSFDAASGAIENMKDDFDVVIDSTVETLKQAGMTEEHAIAVVVTHLSDLVMAHDMKDS